MSRRTSAARAASKDWIRARHRRGSQARPAISRRPASVPRPWTAWRLPLSRSLSVTSRPRESRPPEELVGQFLIAGGQFGRRLWLVLQRLTNSPALGQELGVS